MTTADAKVPTCVGVILDGNRRWAKAKGLPSLEGHKAGYDNIETIGRVARERGIKHVAIYAFSTENWNRSQEEVQYLMGLLHQALEEQLSRFAKEGVRVRVIGQRERFSKEMQAAIQRVEEGSAGNTAITLWVCLSYGGRAEIVAAAAAAAQSGEPLTEENFKKHLWSAEMPDPDIIIRTSGEKRLSGFLTWGSVYSELFFVDTKWPDFSAADIDAILAEYAERERRHGT